MQKVEEEGEEEEEDEEEEAPGFSQHPFWEGGSVAEVPRANERSPGVTDSPPPRLSAHALFFFSLFLPPQSIVLCILTSSPSSHENPPHLFG